MEISHLKRDGDYVKKAFKQMDEQIIAVKECKIYFPERYQEKKLAKIAVESSVLAMYALVVDNHYGVSKVPAMMPIRPDSVNSVKINDDHYFECVFSKGSTVCPNVNLVKNDTLLYDIFNEFIQNGKIPWYFNYKDLGELFKFSKKHTGTELGANRGVTELIIASIARNPNKLTEYYRHSISSLKDIEKNPPQIIKLNSVSYGATDSMSKIIGGYFDEGVMSALVNPSEQIEPIEELLRR